MSYITPENVLKNSLEQRDQGNFNTKAIKTTLIGISWFSGALDELHMMLHGKKYRGNNIILERIMVSASAFSPKEGEAGNIPPQIHKFESITKLPSAPIVRDD